MKDLTNKVALVTGASGGIGRAIALRLAQEGATIVAHYSSSEDKAQQVVDQIEEQGGKAITAQADISQPNAVRKVFETIRDRFGVLDIVITNAGVPARGPVEEVKADQFDKVFSVNTKGVFFCLQEAAKHVADNGRIINISSGQTIHPAVNFAIYSGSKAAPKLFVSVLAQEIGHRGITVNNVTAGPIDAGFLKDAEDDYKEMMASANAMKRLGTAEDVADAVVLIASENARWITGQDIIVDGGATHF